MWGMMCAIKLLLMFILCQWHLQTQDCLIDVGRSCGHARRACRPTAVLHLARHTVVVIATQAARFRRSIAGGCLILLWELLQRTCEARQTIGALLRFIKTFSWLVPLVNSRLLSQRYVLCTCASKCLPYHMRNTNSLVISYQAEALEDDLKKAKKLVNALNRKLTHRQDNLAGLGGPCRPWRRKPARLKNRKLLNVELMKNMRR